MPLTYTALDLITDSCIEVGIIAPGEEANLPGDTAQWGFRKLNYLMDTWDAMRAYVYTTVFSVFTLIPNHTPHTIGPGGDFDTTPAQRPVRIEAAALLLNGSSTEVDVPIYVRDDQWWAANQTKSITSTVPTDLYYSAAYELGQGFFWPVPSIARDVRLELWTTLTSFVNITDPIGGLAGPGTLPQGYRNALMLTLAESLCPGSEKELHTVLAASGKLARQAVFGNNAQSPRIATRDSGMPRSGGRGYFNWGFGGPPGLGPR